MASAPVSTEPSTGLARRTAPDLWRYVLAQRFGAPAYLEEREDGWREVSWQEAGERVEVLAHALLARGVRRGDVVGVLARTQLEWVLLDWAAMSIGAAVVGLYPSNTATECAYILSHAEAVLAFAEDDDQTEKLSSIRDDLPGLRDIVRFEELPALETEGRAHREAHPEALDAAAAAIQEDDLGTLIYTSGTTGPPKGCMLSQKNLVTAAVRVQNALQDETDVVLLFLPLAHSFGRIAYQAAAYHGSTVAFCAEVTRVPEAIAAVRPTILPAVPRVYEKIHANVLGEIEHAGGARRAVGRWALRVGSRASRLRRAGRPLPSRLRLEEQVADRLVFAKVRKRLGGRLRVGVSGAAPLGLDVLEFFHSLGMLVIEGYGLTETSSSLSVNDPDDFRFGTVGRAVPGCEVRLADDGWFRTGDVGEIDDDGFLKITDRKKDLIITAGGKNISPQNLENALKASRFVSQALVVGDRRPYVTALLTLDPDEVRAAGREPQELAQEIVDDVNRDRVRVEQIKRFTVLPRDFSQDEGEITPTLKLRRKVVHEHFADDIERLYSS